MGAVFASAARAPLTSLASVVEMTGDFALTLPVMLAVAIASTISRALSYGTIYTTKLLRRGTDIDRTTPWRALHDLKVADAMRPFRPPLPVPPGDRRRRRRGRHGTGLPGRAGHLPGRPAGPVRHRIPRPGPAAAGGLRPRRPARAVRRRPPDTGWVTAPDVLRAIARQITTAQAETAQAQLAADWDHADPESRLRHPPTPLPGYQVTEITITAGSPAAGRKLGDLTWPPASTPVSVLHGHQLRPPRPETHPGPRRPRQPAHRGTRRLTRTPSGQAKPTSQSAQDNN